MIIERTGNRSVRGLPGWEVVEQFPYHLEYREDFQGAKRVLRFQAELTNTADTSIILYDEPGRFRWEPPFRGENPVTIAYKHVQEAPVPPRAAGADIAESLEAITLKLLAKDPSHRYPTAEDLRADLRRYREGGHRLRRSAVPAAAAVATGGHDPAAVSTRVTPAVAPAAPYSTPGSRPPRNPTTKMMVPCSVNSSRRVAAAASAPSRL